MRRPEPVMSPTTTTGGLVCAHHHLYSALAARHARAAPHARVVPGDPGADLVAARRRARPRDVALVGDARRARGAGVRDDRDRRPSRVAQRHRGQPDRDRRRVRRGRRACRVRVRRHRPARRRRRECGAGRERAVPPRRWTRPGRHPRGLHLHRRHARGRGRARRATSASGVHIHVAEGTDDADAAKRLAHLTTDELAARALRPPRGRRRAARHHRPQPPLQHEQRGRLRPARLASTTRWCSAPTASAPTCSKSSASPTPGCAKTT